MPALNDLLGVEDLPTRDPPPDLSHLLTGGTQCATETLNPVTMADISEQADLVARGAIIMPVSNIPEEGPTSATSVPYTKEGGNMGIYVFQRSMEVLNPDTGKIQTVDYIIVTSIFLNQEEEEGYEVSSRTREVKNGVFAIPQGSYLYRLMIERAVKRGFHFRATAFPQRHLNLVNYQVRTMRATASWSTAERGTFLHVLKTDQKYFDGKDVIKNFGFGMLGLNAIYGKKLTKRLQEILRSSQKTIYIENDLDVAWTTVEKLKTMPESWGMDRLVIAEFPTPDHLFLIHGEAEALKFYDGMNVIDLEVVIRALKEQLPMSNEDQTRRVWSEINRLRALKAEGHRIVGRTIFRLLGIEGLIKGDALVVVDLKKNTGADVIFHPENLKKELMTDGWTIVAIENHAPLHGVRWDEQSKTNFPFGLTEAQQRKDIDGMYQAALDVVEGDPPKWLFINEDAHVDTMGVKSPTVVELARQDFQRWQAYGMELFAAQNYGAVWLNGIVNRMENFLNRDQSSPGFMFNYKPFIQMSHAISVGVTTYHVIEDMAQISLSELSPRRKLSRFEVNIVPHVGALFPDDRWLAVFDLHGTQDLDDTNSLHTRMVYCSNADHLKGLVEDGVIGANVVVPTTPEEAREMFLVIRSPNGSGEYSMEVPGTTQDDPDTPVLDLAKMPRGQKFLLSKSNPIKIHEDTTRAAEYGKVYDRNHALYIMTSQAMNPGIGRVSNALMNWHEVVGPQLPVGIPPLGDMVDAVEQGHDRLGIKDVIDAPIKILQQLARVLQSHPNLRTDRIMVTERLAGAKGKYMPLIKQRMAGVDFNNDKVGKRTTRINTKYLRCVADIRQLMKDTLLQKRAETDLYKVIKTMRYDNPAGREDMKWAREHMDDMRYRFKQISQDFHPSPKDSPLRKAVIRKTNNDLHRNVIEEKVELLMADPKRMPYRIVACYKHLIRGNDAWPLGFFDQQIFRSAGAEVALFDLLGQVVRDFELLKPKAAPTTP